MTAKAAIDPLRSRAFLEAQATARLAAAKPFAPLVNPLHAAPRGLPPVLILLRPAKTPLDDAARLAGAADLRGLQVWPAMIHAWTLFYRDVAALRRALAEAGAFVRAPLG